MSAHDYLATYLDDHVAGSAAAIELIERWRARTVSDAITALLEEIEAELRSDQQTLIDLRGRLAGGPGIAKPIAGWFAEKLSRLKLAFVSEAAERFALFESLELLATGIQGKRAMWAVLKELTARQPRLQGVDYGVLILRAQAQYTRVDQVRMDLARQVLIG
ncbi:MAG TPA: hypothetical protein VFV98_08690 [Vicinamibacterales bacterium]|nr:hypothetical protein [Vicinamibacterales bacterium]